MTLISGGFAWPGMALILGGALLRAFYTINNKRNLKRVSPRFMIVVNMLGAGLILLVAMFIFQPPRITDWISWPQGLLWPLVTTGTLNIVIQYAELKALQLEDASLIAPMSTAAPLLALLSGFIILKELPTAPGWIGVMLISLGSYILNLNRPSNLTGWRRFLQPWLALGQSRGVRLALLGAMLASISINFDKLVALQTPPFFLPGVVFTAIGLLMLPWLKTEHIPRGLARREKIALLISPCLFACVTCLFVAALSFGLASYSSALRRTTLLFVILLAGPLLKEHGHPERIWGGVVMMVGVILLAL